MSERRFQFARSALLQPAAAYASALVCMFSTVPFRLLASHNVFWVDGEGVIFHRCHQTPKEVALSSAKIANGIEKPDQIVRPAQAARELGVTVRTIYRWEAAGLFPRRVKIGPGASGFLRSELDAHRAALVAQRDGAAQ